MSKEKEGFISKLVGLRTIKLGFSQTVDLLKELKTRNNNEYITETFDEALERHGIPEEKREFHLINVYKNLKISFIILFFAAILFLFLGVFRNIYLGNILASVAYISLIFAFLSVMANNSFRCYQIRNKKLGGLSLWLKNYKEWFPISLSKAWNK